jgi:hypothetical protein
MSYKAAFGKFGLFRGPSNADALILPPVPQNSMKLLEKIKKIG